MRAAPSAPAGRLLHLLGRFGYLLLAQAAALDGGHTPRLLALAAAELEARGWSRHWLLASGGSRTAVHALTPAGLRALRRLPGAGPRPAAVLPGRVDALLAAAGLAVELRSAGTWHTWAEWRQGAGPFAAEAPAGVLEPPAGHPVPVWIVLDGRGAGARLRRALAEAARLPDLGPAQVRALPALCGALEGCPADVVPWAPPHLRGRAPFLPGWRAAGGATGPGPAGRALLAFLDRFGAATTEQCARETGSGSRGASAALHRLGRLGLAERRQAGRTAVWRATAPGLRACGSRRRPAHPDFHPAHTLALVDLARTLEAETGGRWEAEREIAPETRARFAEDGIPPPDGRLTLPDGRRILVQLQRTRGPVGTQLREAWRQCRLGLGEEVWFCCFPDVAPAYRRALQDAERGFISVRDYAPTRGPGAWRPKRPESSGTRSGRPRRVRSRAQPPRKQRP